MASVQPPVTQSPRIPPPSGRPRLSAKEFEQIRRFLYDCAGIDLQPGKEELVAVRLGRFLGPRKLRSFEEYFDCVRKDRTGALLTEMIDALTTNHTGFFREPAHFEFLRRKILPVLKERPRIDIWSAASSTGEEPFSVAISLLEDLGLTASSRVRILATDISTKVLEKAKLGAYPQERMGGVPPELVKRYFTKASTEDGISYQVRPDVRNIVNFQRMNLMEPVRHGRTFPLIFLRNVMIYFDRKTQEDLIGRLFAHIEPGGYLFIGHSESLGPVRHGLDYVQPAIYRRPAAGGR